MAIRRHTPGTTDPRLQKPSPRNYPQAINSRLTTQRNQSQLNSYSPPNRNHSPVSFQNRPSVSVDHDDRPIKPMKDTSIYTKPLSQKKTIPPRKPPPSRPKSILSSSRYEYDAYQSPPPPPSRNQASTISQRRPVRTDLIPRTPFGIAPQRRRSRQVVVEEYVDDDEEYYPVTYVKQVPTKVVSYQPVSGMTTRELENYHMSKSQRIVRVRSPPVERIIYRS